MREAQEYEEQNGLSGVQVENGSGGNKRRLTASHYLNPTKVKPEWLLNKER